MNRKILLIVASIVFVCSIAAAILLFSGPHMRNQSHLRAFETTMALPPANTEFYSHKTFRAEDIIIPESTESNVAKGKTYYGYYCIFCHGENGKGNGPVGESYMPHPADLTSDSVKTFSTAELYRRSFTGTGHAPVLERVVPEDFRSYILMYIREGFQD